MRFERDAGIVVLVLAGLYRTGTVRPAYLS
jgi:hypothetical protein